MRITQAPVYSDLDLNMIPHPLTGDLVPKTNIESVRQSMRHLLLLEPFDIPFDPDKHSSLKLMLFDGHDQLTTSRIKTHVEWVIRKCEPRVTLQKLDVVSSADFLGYSITLWYTIKSIMVDDSFQFFVQRAR